MQNLADSGSAFLGIGLLIILAFYAVGALIFYLIVRLAVRHGTLDAWRRLPGVPGVKRDPGSPTAP